MMPHHRCPRVSHLKIESLQNWEVGVNNGPPFEAGGGAEFKTDPQFVTLTATLRM